MKILEIIRSRKTEKVLADPENPWPVVQNSAIPIDAILEAGRWAPFHYPSHKQHRGHSDDILPWHAYTLDSQACRILLKKLMDSGLDGGKIFGLLAAAEFTILVTWKPNPELNKDSVDEYYPSLENMEHIAAASAAIQNMLLQATEASAPNYWSSGGILRESLARDLVGIPCGQILLGALFLFPKKELFPTPPVKIVPGKLRHSRPKEIIWTTSVSL